MMSDSSGASRPENSGEPDGANNGGAGEQGKPGEQVQAGRPNRNLFGINRPQSLYF